MTEPVIATRDAWLEARQALLKEEKALTRARDALAAKRRALPWLKVDKAYRFKTAEGEATLADLFGGKRQLIVQHFMFSPEWDEGCTGCSLMADHVSGILPHLTQKDVAYVAVSRAPIAKLQAFRQRMGWSLPWVSSEGSDFSYDFGASFTPEQMAGAPASYNFEPIQPPVADLPGASVFIRADDGQIYLTYSQFARGVEDLMAMYRLLDMTPLGRQEGDGANVGSWIRLRDTYGPQTEPGCPACATASA